ncbi:hypothetical protein ACFYXQ_00090 [Nocardia jiangxiensis]|uniref:Uncharacterized protein n=1 Tax=Nocardia jiangxiensis TaxID=282685 RepID=A0ABW6RRG5_9NOCA
MPHQLALLDSGAQTMTPSRITTGVLLIRERRAAPTPAPAEVV